MMSNSLSTFWKVVLAVVAVAILLFGIWSYGEIRALQERTSVVTLVNRIDDDGGDLTQWLRGIQDWVTKVDTRLRQVHPDFWEGTDPPSVPPPPPGWGDD
jgi:hypothetical protein